MTITKKVDMTRRFLAGAAFALLAGSSLSAQQAVELKQVSLGRWSIGAANYSGITSLGGDSYAVVSDKEPQDGFFLFRITQNATTGDIESVRMEGFKGNPNPPVDSKGISTRDTEGIAYYPAAKTLFISGEGDQAIWEYDLAGRPTGRQMRVPGIMATDKIVGNYGFEALAYDAHSRCFWTVTESTLLADGVAAGPKNPGAQNLLRLQSFDENLKPLAQYAYRMDRGIREDFGPTYVFGVPAVTALPDGRLLVLEREANISRGYLSSWVRCKLFEVNPVEAYRIDSSTDLKTLDGNRFMTKKLLADFTTRLTPFNLSFANYEGMCLGRTLSDGRRTVLVISDSQAGAGVGPVRLRDYLKVLILPD